MIKGKYKELIRRIWNTIIGIFIYRIGCYIPLPCVNPELLNKIINSNQGGFLNSLDVFAGGSISKATIFALGVYPYISASLLMQFLTSNIGIDYFIQLKKKGNSGQEQINAYTKYMTIVFGLFQSIIYCTYISTQKYQGFSPIYVSKSFFFFIAIIHMLAGLIFLIWLGNQITKKGICNGVSLIVFAGIMSNFPKGIVKAYNLLSTGKISPSLLLVIGCFIFLIILFTIFVETSRRAIEVRYPYSKLFTSVDMSKNHILPMKINNASIMPSIMSAAIIMAPGLVQMLMNKLHITGYYIDKFFLFFARGSAGYYLLYGFAIVFFTVLYTPMIFEPGTLSNQLQKSNCILENWRPGQQTALNLHTIINNLGFLAAIYLFILCVFVEFMVTTTGIPFIFSGTSFLIAVGVALEIYDSYKAHASNLQCLVILKEYTISSALYKENKNIKE